MKRAVFIAFFVVLMAAPAFAGSKWAGPWKSGQDLGDANMPFEYVFTEYLSLEGATYDAYETLLRAVDPTADNTIYLPNYNGLYLMGSTLATNAPDAAGSIWGSSAGLVCEGSTANDYELTIACTDPTADRTVTIPDQTGTAVVADVGTTVRYATVEISNAEIKGLRATPKELVAAPGAGYLLEFCGATIIMDYGTNALTESGDNLAIEYDGGSGSAVTAAIETTGFIDQEVDQVAIITPATMATDAAADVANKNIALVNTGDGEFGGNADADTTLTVKVAYRVHATGL